MAFVQLLHTDFMLDTQTFSPSVRNVKDIMKVPPLQSCLFFISIKMEVVVAY